MKIRIFTLIFCISIIFQAKSIFSQSDTLKLQTAIEIALENNYSIKLINNDLQIANINNSLGNAGFFPKISLDGSFSNYYNNINQQMYSGEEINYNFENANSLSGGIIMNWTVFNGFKMFIEKDKLEKTAELTEIEIAYQTENLISEVIFTYYAIILEKRKYKVLSEANDLSKQRTELTKVKFEIGSDSELSYLQALVDLNKDSTELLKQKVQITNRKALLNNLLNRDLTIDFEIEDSIIIGEILLYDDLLQNIKVQNSEILYSNKNVEIELINKRLSYTTKYPNIYIFGGYNLNVSNYDYGTISSNFTHAPVMGIGISYTIFDGMNRKRTESIAEIQANSAKIEYQQTVKTIENELFQTYNLYENYFSVLQFEMNNIETVKKNTEIAYEQYKLGRISDIEFRQTQIKQIEAENNLLLMFLEVKQLEIELLRLSGSIVGY